MEETPKEHPTGFTARKKVDDSWKQSVEQEKKTIDESGSQEEPYVEPGFIPFASSLGLQAMAALGEIKDPARPEAKPDLRQAQYLIDILQMLFEKTQGNLSAQESQIMENLMYELRVKFVEKKRGALS